MPIFDRGAFYKKAEIEGEFSEEHIYPKDRVAVVDEATPAQIAGIGQQQ